MIGRLTGKTVLVTGAGRGIGRAITQRMAQQGAHIAAADVEADSLERLVAELPTESIALSMDITSAEAVRAGVEKTIEHLGQLDILVNNAGYLVFTTYEDCSEAVWDRIVEVNMKGTFLCCQAVLQHMKRREQGVIINMSSLAAKTGGVAAGPPYAASKAGISALTIGMARSVAKHGIRVNAIAPGIIETAMTDSAEHAPLKAQIPIGYTGQPDDVANCALFLASDEARHITGEIIDVNGGLFMD